MSRQTSIFICVCGNVILSGNEDFIKYLLFVLNGEHIDSWHKWALINNTVVKQKKKKKNQWGIKVVEKIEMFTDFIWCFLYGWQQIILGTKPLPQPMLTYHSKIQWHSAGGGISQEIHQPSITKISLKMTYLKFHSNLPGANELIHHVVMTHLSVNDCCYHWFKPAWHQPILVLSCEPPG